MLSTGAVDVGTPSEPGRDVVVERQGGVVEVEWMEEQVSDWETAEAAMATLWHALDLQGGRSYVRVPGVGEPGQASDLPRQYCELLRLRA